MAVSIPYKGKYYCIQTFDFWTFSNETCKDKATVFKESIILSPYTKS